MPAPGSKDRAPNAPTGPSQPGDKPVSKGEYPEATKFVDPDALKKSGDDGEPVEPEDDEG